MQIRSFNHPVLRKKCAKLTPEEISQIVNKQGEYYTILEEMKGIVTKVGIGLAASQIGVEKQLMIIKPKDEITVIINPQLIEIGDHFISNYEGCLSVPGIFEFVERPSFITVKFTSEQDKEVTAQMSGEEAIVFLHEYDHLCGILFIDRSFNRFQRREFKRKFKFDVESYKPEFYEVL